MNQTDVITNILESVFNTGPMSKGPSSLPFDKSISSVPFYKDIVRPFDTGPINKGPNSRPISKRPTSGPIGKGPTVTLIHEGPTVTPSTVRPIAKKSTARPFHETTHRRQWGSWTPSHERSTLRPIYQRPTVSTFSKWPTTRQRWNLKPPDIEVKRTNHVSTVTGFDHSTNLENFLWVALGGFVVLVLMALIMKLGNPIRRVRRQLSNARAAPNLITRRQDRDDSNLDTGSLLRLTETAASTDAGPLYDDLPPPYSECVNTTKTDTEEPPPSFSTCFVTYTHTKDTEPKVHIQRQNVLFEDEDESIEMNNSEDVDRIRTELVLVNGRIVERPKLDLNSHNNETEVASNDNVKGSRHVDVKDRVLYNDETGHVKVNIY